jgi:hypothetical protein
VSASATRAAPAAWAACAARTTADAIALIESAGLPRDLFGADASRCYRRLARLTHPDACPGDARAAAAFARLAALWRRHASALGPGSLLARGDIANIYRQQGGLLKLARDPADNDLIDREAAALTRLRQRAEPRHAAYLPVLAARQLVTDPRSGAERHGNLIGYLGGFRSLAEVRAARPGGLDPRDAAWMWRRLLVAIGVAHRAGVVHRAVLPEHVLIEPAEHGLVLIDWCYSGPPGTLLPAYVRQYRDWYPPEVFDRQPAGPDTDIWLATRCMTELAGGLLPQRLTSFARGCQLASPRHRPQDAWQLLAELDELLGRLYGPRRFRPFAMPA